MSLLSSPLTRRQAGALLLSTVAAATLAACGSSGSDSGEVAGTENTGAAMTDFAADQQFKATEPVSFTCLFSDHPIYPYKADWLLFEEITKRTNVTLDMTIVPMSDYSQKRSLLVSSGDAPLIMPKTYPGQEDAFVSSGAILAVSDYFDLMPNFQKKVSDWKMEADLDTIRKADGSIYVLPGLHEEIWPDYTFEIRKDLLDEQGIALPTTWQELQDAIAKVLQAHPEMKGISDRFEGLSMLNLAAVSYGTQSGGSWGMTTLAEWDEDTSEYVFCGTSDNYKAMLEMLHGMVEAGVLDPDSFTQDEDTAVNNFTAGRTVAIGTNSQYDVSYETSMKESLGEGNFEICKVLVPAGPAGALMGGTRLENGIMISSKATEAPNFVAMMQFIDWLWYSDEGEEFCKWGVEGVTYTKAEDGTRTLMPEINYNGLNPAGTTDLRIEYGFSGGVFAYGGTTELLHSMMLPKELAWQEEMAATHTQAPIPPAAPLDESQQEQATLLKTPLQDFVMAETLKFITGQRSLSEWDSYVSEISAQGVEQYMQIINDAQKAAAKA
ncbi:MULTISPECIES: extracellular solute-binding protein [unclassified Actinomyces]|uniref:ABC transporter substrate-binding protein n=1 Tax=unclassified Actinomyces TaxID=2609248 RepID=UPI00201823F6|nr:MULTISPECIES: extracellular solute-binding protein [unclassified Actinomyces]MCL3777164.1 extracellular solute-binding protein [Actinomyces sp. AC-20-1]MCL3789012.1 extracellular solute-binding protein [Actinomyces sp. 187325]MCL3791367.1 extracellular solute-binding protein [Actinomyces sp. 186855]MCL3793922.1 extracellular solute-binding protein [Actinomyces sp. 217892]